MAKSFFTIDEISQIVNGKGASLLPKKEVKEKEPLADRDELLKMVFGGAILPSQTLQDSALQLDQALASNKALNGLRTATAVASLVGDAAVESVGIAEESYNNIKGENALAKKISKNPIERLEKNAFGSEGKKKILAALGIDEEDTREVEVEGGEIIENEDGTTQKVEGPRHEQGGVDAMIDDDATVYSDRLQSLIGASKVEKTAKSIAEEKEKRDAKALSLQKKLEKNPNDRLLANTLALTLQQNMIADQMDLMWQQVARTGLEEQAGGKEQLMNDMFNKQEKQKIKEPEQEPETEEVLNEESEPAQEEETDSQQQEEAQEEEIEKPEEEEVNQEKLALGKERTKEKLFAGADPTITPPADPNEELTEDQKKAQEEAARISLISEGVGNILGNQLYSTGAVVSGLGGLNTTLQQRSEDILHENKHKGLARGVDKLYEQSISNISNVTNKRLQEMLNESQTTKQSIGNNFQSISNMAAYNAMLDDAVNKELAKIRGEELGAIAGVQDARAKVLSANMQKEMEGQGIAETLNDADRDAFYNALHLDYANIGTQMQAVASNMNKKYEDKTDLKKLLDAIENIGKDNKPQGGGENGTPSPESPETEDDKAGAKTPPPQPAQSDAANTGTGTTSPQPTQQPEASTVDANMKEETSPQSTVPKKTQSNDEGQIKTNGLEQILEELKIAQYLKQNQPEDDNAGTGTTSPLLTQTADTNTGAGTTTPPPAQSDVPSDEELKNLTYEDVYELFEYAVLNNQSDEAKLRLAQEMDKKEKEKRDAAKKEEEETTPQESAQAEVANEENLTDELFDVLFRLAIYAEENGYELSDDLKAIAKKGKEKRDAAKKEEEKTEAAENNNKEDNSGIVTQQKTQEHKTEVAPTTEVAVPQINTTNVDKESDGKRKPELKNPLLNELVNNAIKANLIPQEKEKEQKKKEAKNQVDVMNEDIEKFTEYIEMIKKGEYRKSYILDLLETYKSYMNSEINYLEEDIRDEEGNITQEGNISEDKRKKFTETLSEAKELMDKYEIDINNYSPTIKKEGEKYTEILLFNSSGDAKSTVEGTIDKKRSKEITQDELLTLIRNINTEYNSFSEEMSYVTPSFANVDIYDKERYPLSTLKAYRESLNFSDSEKEFLDKLIERREFVDDAIENGKIPVTENTLLKLDLARDAYIPWLNKNLSLQINTNNTSYLGSISKDFISEYEKNKNNLVFFNNKIKIDFNYAIDEIENLYKPNDIKRKEFEEQMKRRWENIKIAEEQGKIIYEKNYPFYINMDKINQEPIYYNTKDNLIKLKKTITDIIDDYEKNKDKFYYPNDFENNSEDGKESHYKDIMSLKNKMNQIEEKLKGFEQKEQTE